MELLDQLETQLNFEGMVLEYLRGLRSGVSLKRPRGGIKRRAYDMACEDFSGEMEHMLTCNGEKLT